MKNNRTIWPLICAAIVVVAMFAIVYFVRTVPETAPSNPPDRGQTEENAPAGPADRNEDRFETVQLDHDADQLRLGSGCAGPGRDDRILLPRR